MAGKQGKSGGPRPNSGGARPGAGRKKMPPVLAVVPTSEDPKAVLTAIMNDDTLDMRLRLEAAKALLPYTHARKGEPGKKVDRQAAAHQANAGRFATPKPPRLAAVLPLSGGK